MNNPALYEINTRVFLRRYGQAARINDVPADFWKDLASKGINYVWLMGIWKTCDSIIEKCCFEPVLVKSYDKALKGWKKEDIIGSPYAIDKYEVNPTIASAEELALFRNKLHSLGIKLILDFVPNHFSAASSLLKTNPGIFIQVDKDQFEREPHTFFKPFEDEEKYFAHGRDPFFPAWQDTVQVNFCSDEARNFLTQTLAGIASLCDGVRCDMAMLAMSNVFRNTWAGVLSNQSKQCEFWPDAVEKVKSEWPHFVFIAETYWDLEWNLQSMGFDYTYDKKLTDRLRLGVAFSVREHLLADDDYQNRSVRFIENHDEERAVTAFGKEKSKVAALVISTIKGMKLYHDGQFEGRKIKLPVQLGREPHENVNHDIRDFYSKLLAITAHAVFRHGKWSLLEPQSSWFNNSTFQNILAWEWRHKDERRVVAINFSEEVSSCRLKFELNGFPENIELKDLLDDQIYLRSAEEIQHIGLYIELRPWKGHIFAF